MGVDGVSRILSQNSPVCVSKTLIEARYVSTYYLDNSDLRIGSLPLSCCPVHGGIGSAL